MNETALTRKLRARIKELGGMSYKMHGGPYMPAGLPDLLVAYKGRLHLIEVKRPKGKLTDVQRWQHERLAEYGITVAVIHSIEELEDWTEQWTKF